MLAGLVAGVLVLVTAPAAGQQAATAEGVVLVAGAESGAEDWSGATLGFVAESGLVIASVMSGETLFSVVAAADTGGTSYEARLMSYDVPSGLGLLAVPELEARPYVFASGAARVGQTVHGFTWEPVGDSATVAEMRTFSPVSGPVGVVDTLAAGGRGMIAHAAFEEGRRNAGGPLLNICGEVVGVVVGTRGRADAPVSSAAAVPAPPLLSRFAIDGLSVEVAADTCLSDEERRLAEQQARLQREAARADSLEAAVQAERAQRAELERVRDSVAEATTQARQEALELREQSDSLQQEVRSTQERFRLRTYIGVAAAAIAIVLITVVGYRAAGRAKHRAAAASGKADEAERKAAEAEREAVRAEQAARTARSDLAARDARDRMAGEVPGVLLEVVAGSSLAVKVPGRVIASAEGAVVGRSPFTSAVVLDHPEVSRRHFRLSARGSSLLVEDLGSTNGTTLDGVQLQPGEPAPLKDGARLSVGGLSVTVTVQPSRPSSAT